jgi:hypothetical protein
VDDIRERGVHQVSQMVKLMARPSWCLLCISYGLSIRKSSRTRR